MNYNFFLQRDNRIPNLNTSTRAQHKHEPAMKAVRVNGQITEVKQLRLRLILRWVTIYDPYILSLFQFGYDWQIYIRQNRQI